MKIGFPAVTLLALSVLLSPQTSRAEDSPGFWRSFVNFFLPHPEQRKILLKKETQYYQVTVEEDSAGARHLVFNPMKGSQGIWNPATPDEIISNYCKYTTLFFTFIKTPPKRVLFIGLGVGMVPRFVRNYFPNTVIDIVEIDKDIPEIAAKYFGYIKDDRTNIIIKDGRDFINRTKKKYDIIFIDAYNAKAIPFQLTTREFYLKVKNALAQNGIATINIANLGREKFIASELKTIESVFPHVAVYVCPHKSNYVPFASVDMPLDSQNYTERAEEVDKILHLSYKMQDMLETRMPEKDLRRMTGNAVLLTDDYAPVETMQ